MHHSQLYVAIHRGIALASAMAVAAVNALASEAE